ncbi:DUF3429 domain-containing protein [Leucothrix arctica]|uniref:DUF3429 domain-containing protein n=1 Tax=Leucothrix arctica TaxID=1481894 RepID=A0A317C517_9GAMM|nr:DUF3429 domain-containing protein [Leucothrix arctica]PWQ93369.1 hypothetical protein DKT75_17175 [Leucothrix arctica]
MKNSILIPLLTYLGAAPFFLANLLELANIRLFDIDSLTWFMTYGFVILSFMAGTLWGQVVNESAVVKGVALATNGITLAAWFGYLLAVPSLGLIVSALGFVALYVLEAFVMKQMKRPDYYLDLRLRVTVLVVLAHCIMLFQI